MKTFISLILNACLAMMFAVGLSASYGWDVQTTAGSIFGLNIGLQFIGKLFGGVASGGMAFGTINTEVWRADIENALFQGVEFVQKAMNHDAWVNNLTVNLPQSGGGTNIEKNRSSYPATASQRTDTIKLYNIDEFTTDPIHIPNVEEVQTSYDKRASVLKEHMDALNERIGLEAAFAWASNTGARQVRTSGGAGTSLAPSATGTRKKLTGADLLAMQKLFDSDKGVGKMNRYALIPAGMYHELLEDLNLLSRDYAEKSSLEEGFVNMLYSFQIFTLPETVIYDNAATPQKKAIGAAGAITDNLGAIFWQESKVGRAVGATEVFEDNQNPLYYGDIMSALARFGAATMRTDEKGVGVIVQEA